MRGVWGTTDDVNTRSLALRWGKRESEREMGLDRERDGERGREEERKRGREEEGER